MSTFDGVLKEYPLISIDSFEEGKNYASTTYFLSHCHSDHMRGLNFHEFFKLLRSSGFRKIYLSDVSNHLLRHDQRYQHLSDYLVVLRIEDPTIINIYDALGNVHSTVTVTLLTAGHCPGSVMFYFEGDNGNVLYTGDFRLPVGSAARLKHLYEGEILKPLESIYIDTTFCNAKCLYIPSREECLKEILSIVEPWFSKGPNYIVYFLCPYELAYEFVFVELHKRFGFKTHVTDELKEKYMGIKLIENAVTVCASEARIHACILDTKNTKQIVNQIKDFYQYRSLCGFASSNKEAVHVIKIKPSAMFFTRNKLEGISDYNKTNNLHRVYYSTHPSLSEIQDMIFYLKPKHVFPNVVKGQTTEEILDLIFHYEITPAENKNDVSDNLSFSPLGKLKSPSLKDASSQENDSLPFFDDCYATPSEKKITAKSSAKRSQSYNLKVDTDYENSSEMETMLREEIYSQKVESESFNEGNKSQLKWENPVVSSDEEVFPSSDSSAEDKDDSDTSFETSQEASIKSSAEEHNQIKDETSMQPDSENEISQETGVKMFLEKIKGRNIPTIELNNCIDESGESIRTNYSNNELVNNYLNTSQYDKGKNNVFSDKRSLEIDMEYSKISEVDNGVSSITPDPEELNKNYPHRHFSSYTQHCNKEMQNFPTSSKFNIDSNSKCTSFEKLKTNNQSSVSIKDLNMPPVENTARISPPPHYVIPQNSNNIQSKIKNEAALLNHSNFATHLDLDQCAASMQKVLPKNERVCKSVDSSIKTNGDKSKTFYFVKKINSSSESEDEYDFKYVIKKSFRSKANTVKILEKPNQKQNVLNSSNVTVNPNQNVLVKNKVEKNVITNGIEENISSKNKLKLNSSTFNAPVKGFELQQTEEHKTSNAVHNNATESKTNDESKIQNMVIDKTLKSSCNSYSSTKYYANSHNHTNQYSENVNLCKNFKDIESIFKDTDSCHLDSESLKTPGAILKANTLTKTYQNNSLDINVVKDVEAELIDISSDQSSEEICIVNAGRALECKILSNVKNTTLQITESKLEPSETPLASKQLNTPTNLKLTCNSNKENTSCAVDNFKTHETDAKYYYDNNLEQSSTKSNSIKNSSNSSTNESNLTRENKVFEKFCSTWEIKSVSQSSSGSSVIVEEIISHSDLDDSPSLLAPNVPIPSSNNNFSASFKRRKIECITNNSSFEEGNCDKVNEICDNYIVDSDSTPELF